MTHLDLLVKKVGDQSGKQIYTECLRVGTKDKGEIYDSVFSSMEYQTESYCELVQQHPVFGKSDFNIIALSQGGLLARDMIQNCDLGEHKVHNFLSVAGPQQGIMKTPNCLDGFWCNLLTAIENHGTLLSWFQNNIAPAAYWRDHKSPKFYEEYLEYATYLPEINNEKQHAKMAQYKSRFSNLNRAGLVLFENDTIIYPRESTQFGEIGTDGSIVHMKDTEIYKSDAIGLKTLDEEKKLFLEMMPAKNHMEYTNVFFFERMLPLIFEKEWTPIQQNL